VIQTFISATPGERRAIWSAVSCKSSSATSPQLNAITIRDTPDKIAIAQKIIEANDKSRSEILLNVEILEVNRDQSLHYGIDLSNYVVTQDLLVNSGEGAGVGQVFGNQFSTIDSASWRFTVPSITYNALARDQRTKILADPRSVPPKGQVTVGWAIGAYSRKRNSNSHRSSSRTEPDAFPTTTFQQQDIQSTST
jgi:general secretion pathway protein D